MTPKPVATPARAPTNVVPKAKPCPKPTMPSGPSGPHAAKASPAKSVVASAKSTPIRSPELKRSKKESINSPEVSNVTRNLGNDFDLADGSHQSSGASQPVSWLYAIW